MAISWETTQAEFELINQIAARAEEFVTGLDYTRQDILMDLTATHCNGCRLDLTRLLKASEADFGHDILGIRRHLNRTTGHLDGCFVPRLAERY